jgi:hypothetical protein
MIERIARLGYASKALVYAIVGGLATAAAMNRGGRVTDTSGALRVILRQPYGHMLLIVLTIGLCGYAVWRLMDAFMDPDRHGTSFGGLVIRIGNVIRGAIYGTLGIEAFRLSRGLRRPGGDEAELWAARFMDLPLGEWLVGLAGVVIAVYGASQVIGSLKPGMHKSLDLSAIPRGLRAALMNVSRFGVGARGVIIAAAGTFLVRAALERDPSEAAGTRESILELAGAVNGRWLLAAIGTGLIAYSIHQAIQAWCRRIRPVI